MEKTLWDRFLHEMRNAAPNPLPMKWLLTLKNSELKQVEEWEKAYTAGVSDNIAGLRAMPHNE